MEEPAEVYSLTIDDWSDQHKFEKNAGKLFTSKIGGSPSCNLRHGKVE